MKGKLNSSVEARLKDFDVCKLKKRIEEYLKGN